MDQEFNEDFLIVNFLKKEGKKSRKKNIITLPSEKIPY